MIPLKVKAQNKKVNIFNVSEVSKFHKACGEGKFKEVEYSLDKGISINARGEDSGWSALQWASMYGRTAVVQLLLSRGATVNATNDFGRTALIYATIHDHLSVVSILLSNGALINTSNRSGKTAFNLAKSPEIKDLLKRAMIYERRRSFLLFLAYCKFLIPQPTVKDVRKKEMDPRDEFLAAKISHATVLAKNRAEKVLGIRDLHRHIMSFL